MDAVDELLTLAELAIGLAGFSGVVVAFAHQGELTPLDRWRFAGLLSLSMGAAVAAFVPSIFHHLGFTGPSLWRASSAVFLVFALPYVATFPPRLLRMSREIDAVPPASFLAATFVLSTLNLGLQVLNIVGWPHAPGAALFVIGLLAWLVIASLFFGLLVLSRPRS